MGICLVLGEGRMATSRPIDQISWLEFDFCTWIFLINRAITIKPMDINIMKVVISQIHHLSSTQLN